MFQKFHFLKTERLRREKPTFGAFGPLNWRWSDRSTVGPPLGLPPNNFEIWGHAPPQSRFLKSVPGGGNSSFGFYNISHG